MNRIEPNMGPEAYKTYRIASPQATHYRSATCDEVDCPAHEHGWQSVIDEATELGQRQAHYIRRESGRRYREERNELGLTAFTFEAGQACFGQHQLQIRPEMYFVADGDWRASANLRQHTRAADWVEDFGEHQQRIADLIEKG